jgi:hypothetical protein
MSREQAAAIAQSLRDSPFSPGGDAVEQRALFANLMASRPRPAGVVTSELRLSCAGRGLLIMHTRSRCQLLGQVWEEQDRHPRASVVGCLLVACGPVERDAPRAARHELALLHADAAIVLFDFTAELFAACRPPGLARPQIGARRNPASQALP